MTLKTPEKISTGNLGEYEEILFGIDAEKPGRATIHGIHNSAVTAASLSKQVTLP